MCRFVLIYVLIVKLISTINAFGECVHGKPGWSELEKELRTEQFAFQQLDFGEAIYTLPANRTHPPRFLELLVFFDGYMWEHSRIAKNQNSAEQFISEHLTHVSQQLRELNVKLIVRK